MCEWILNAWRDIPEEMVKKSFKKCCITNALDGTEDDLDLVYVSEDENDGADDLQAIFDGEETDKEFLGFESDSNGSDMEDCYSDLKDVFDGNETDEEFLGFN